MNHYPAYGGRLDPQTELRLDELARSPSLPLSALTPAEARGCFVLPSWSGPTAPLATIRDLSIPGPAGPLPLRLYVPRGEPPFPVLVYFHGGGFVLGALPEFDGLCSRVAAGARWAVASVGYRLAPEHRHPAAVEDAAGALGWVASHAREIGVDSCRIAVGGDSAGGNLAAVTALAARDGSGPRLSLQVLVCPWLDLASTDSASFRLFGRGPWLSAESLAWYARHYLADARDAAQPSASPLFARDLSGLPPALIVSAEFDVLRDQGEAYARRLQAAGNRVSCRLYPGTVHDFAVLPGLFERADEAIADICAALRSASFPPAGDRTAR